MKRKLTLFSDLSEDAGGPHWLSPAGKRPQKRPNEKPKPKKKPKGIEQIRREHRTKYRLTQLRARSSGAEFMSECVETMSGLGVADPEYVCQLIWEDGYDDSIIDYRNLRTKHRPGGHDHDQQSHAGNRGGDHDDDHHDKSESKTPASDLLTQNLAHEENLTLEEIKAKLPEDFKAEAAKAEAEMKGKLITQKQYMGEDGKYVPERVELHRKIIRELFTPEAIAKATPAAGVKPVLTLSGGRPAAGKTSSLKKELTEKLKTSFYINADEIQEKLPGYQGRHAGLYNAEAQDVALMAEKVARHMGLNIIYDATLKSKQPAIERVQNYIDAGYEVDGYFVHTTPATSVLRSVGRFMSDPNGHGRYLPPEISFNSRTNESTFDALIPKLRNWAIYDNNGAKPKKIAGSL